MVGFGCFDFFVDFSDESFTKILFVRVYGIFHVFTAPNDDGFGIFTFVLRATRFWVFYYVHLAIQIYFIYRRGPFITPTLLYSIRLDFGNIINT